MKNVMNMETRNYAHMTIVTHCESASEYDSYGLDGPGIESRWGGNFPHLSRPALEPAHPTTQWVLALFRGKALGGGGCL